MQYFEIDVHFYKKHVRCFARQKILANIHYLTKRTLFQPLRGRKFTHAEDSRST